MSRVLCTLCSRTTALELKTGPRWRYLIVHCREQIPRAAASLRISGAGGLWHGFHSSSTGYPGRHQSEAVGGLDGAENDAGPRNEQPVNAKTRYFPETSKLLTGDDLFKGLKILNSRRNLDAKLHPGGPRLRTRRMETDARHRNLVQPEDTDMYIPVKSFFVSRSVDLKGLAKEQFDHVVSSRKELVLRWKDRSPSSPANANKPGIPQLKCWTCERYMVVYNYGSVVLFNFSDDEETESLNVVRKYCKDQFEKPKKDDYGVLIRPTLSGWSHGTPDIILLRKLDVDNIRIIASTLGQSIALDYFAKMVDEMINVFSELNRGMEQTGTFTMTRKKLFQLVATANSTLADVIVRMGLLERSDAAWKNINYARIFEFMREEFELDERFESLYFKLNIIQHNVRLFLEVLQNRKSDILEWIIILLLAGEIGVGVYDILHDTGMI